MNTKRRKLALILVTLATLLVLALGTVLPGVAAQATEPWDGLHNLLAPMSCGAS